MTALGTLRTLTLPYQSPQTGTIEQVEYAGPVKRAEQVEYAVLGSPPPPTTLFLHGLAGSIQDTRPLASGLPGRKVFAHLPGHGRSTGPDPLSYDTLAAAALAVADHEHATAAVGVSLGAATLLRLLTRVPDRFERVVLYLPAVADVPRTREAVAPHHELAGSLAEGDVEGVAAALLRTQPAAVQASPIARNWATRRAKELVTELDADGGDPRRWLPLATAVPLTAEDLPRLRQVRTPVLVIGQEGDTAHPADTARRVAEALPTAELTIFDERGALWGHRTELRDLISGFLRGVSSLQH